MTSGIRRLAASLLLFALGGCASKEPALLPLSDNGSQAHGAAYTADGMHFRKDMPYRPDWEPQPFYYKHCSPDGEPTHYSKTAYTCTDPY